MEEHEGWIVSALRADRQDLVKFIKETDVTRTVVDYLDKETYKLNPRAVAHTVRMEDGTYKKSSLVINARNNDARLVGLYQSKRGGIILRFAPPRGTAIFGMMKDKGVAEVEMPLHKINEYLDPTDWARFGNDFNILVRDNGREETPLEVEAEDQQQKRDESYADNPEYGMFA